jgi:hypothetical protein
MKAERWSHSLKKFFDSFRLAAGRKNLNFHQLQGFLTLLIILSWSQFPGHLDIPSLNCVSHSSLESCRGDMNLPMIGDYHTGLRHYLASVRAIRESPLQVVGWRFENCLYRLLAGDSGIASTGCWLAILESPLQIIGSFTWNIFPNYAISFRIGDHYRGLTHSLIFRGIPFLAPTDRVGFPNLLTSCYPLIPIKSKIFGRE